MEVEPHDQTLVGEEAEMEASPDDPTSGTWSMSGLGGPPVGEEALIICLATLCLHDDSSEMDAEDNDDASEMDAEDNHDLSAKSRKFGAPRAAARGGECALAKLRDVPYSSPPPPSL